MTESAASEAHQDQSPMSIEGWNQSDHKNADLQIISSDNRKFWVSSTMLARHSAVFGSMLSISDHALSNTVQLTDPDTERSYTLCNALEILVAIDDDDPDSLHSKLERLMDPPVVRFAQKYEMKILIAAMKAYLFSSVAQYPPEGGEHILVAAVLGEWALCGRLIATLDHSMHPDPIAIRMMRQRMDWRAWMQGDVGELTEVDSKFAWAVCRAGTKHAGSKMDERICYEAMGEDVAKLMMMEHDQAEDWAESWIPLGLAWWNDD